MKIKYLKIRNIASIEEGDIDFEKGLKDIVNGLPASLFLITGDTGSGKSVILDCISMALYGTTPRIKSVVGKNNNSFFSNNEEMSISDITQYTRIGISHKQDCYSELTFVGNDGKEYVSRFSLGMTNRGNHRNSSWRLIIDKEEIVESSRKEVVRERIRQAIGLSYNQFCRMAMLAQGQFASFLSGGKEERVEILEQLTSTAIFNTYGQAIDAIHRQKKAEYESLNKLCESESSHILSEDEITFLNSEKKSIEVKFEKSKTTLLKTQEEYHNLKDLFAGVSNISDLQKEKSELDARSSEPQYLQAIDKVEKWDATNNERHLITVRNESVKSSETLIDSFYNLFKSMKELEKDVDQRYLSLKQYKLYQEELKEKIKPFEDKGSILEKSGEIILKLESLKSLKESYSEKNKALEKLTNELPLMEAEKLNLTLKLENVAKKIAELTKEYSELNDKRSKINVKSISSQLQEISSQSVRLKTLGDKIRAYDSEKSKLQLLKESIRRLEVESEGMAKEKGLLKTNLEVAEKEYNLAEARYKSMHLSVEENFKHLRDKLAEEKVEICPLCGNRHNFQIETSRIDELFMTVLSPLEEEKLRSLDVMTELRNKTEDFNNNYNFLIARIESEQKSKKESTIRLETEREAIEGELLELKIVFPDDQELITFVDITLPEMIGSLSCKSESLNARLIDAETIDKELERLHLVISEKEKSRNKIESECKLKDSAITTKLQNQNDLAKECTTLDDKILTSVEELSGVLDGRYSGWEKSISSTIGKIEDEASKLSEIRKKIERISDEIVSSERALETIDSHHNRILRIINDFRQENEGLLPADEVEIDSLTKERVIMEIQDDVNVDNGFKLVNNRISSIDDSNVIELWATLSEAFSTLYGRWKETQSVIFESNKQLSQFLFDKDLTEEDLIALMSSEEDIKIFRANKEKMDGEIKLNQERLRLENEKIREIKEKLCLSPTAPLPEEDSLNEITERIRILSEENEDLIKMLGSVNTRLEVNRQNASKLNEILERRDLCKEQYEKWRKIQGYFGGNRFRTLVQSHILRPLIRNANLYLHRITDRFTLTCSDTNEQLSILVEDAYNKGQVRSATLLSGGEKFMISLALSLSLSSMNKSDLNVDILFIDEGFGTLDSSSLNSVMETLRRLPEIVGQNGRRVGVISHREELEEEISSQIRVVRNGDGRSRIEIIP